MRRPALVLLAGCAFLLAGCGGGELVAPLPKTVEGTLPKVAAPTAAQGQKLYTSLGCNACHTLTGAKGVGPTFKGLAGSQVKLNNGQTVTADDAYLISSIEDPDKEIVAGFQKGIMSATIKPGQVSQSDAQALAEYIKTLK
jgi:cytochrome c oxidase subunit II